MSIISLADLNLEIMKKLIIILLISITGLVVSSCNKPGSELSVPENDIESNSKDLLADPEYRQALQTAIASYSDQYAAERGAEFIPAFFDMDYFGFFDDDFVNLATFSTALDADDFYRLNLDGTVTVHIESENALSEVFNYSTYEYYAGFEGHMVMNYTGPVVQIPIIIGGMIVGYINIVVPDENSPATVWHGNGPVQLNGYGPEMDLLAHLTANAAWKKVKKTVHLN